tara:strand:- start:9476 stop:10108 length:633 start_codon:yes stop_codon:yes gene_type:complete
MGRKQKKCHYIYKTVNILSGKYYIGMHSTDNLDDGYLGSGKRLRYSINKHGKDNHVREILEFCDSREELKSREEEIVNLNEIAKVDCMNLKVGGQGGFHSLSACTKGAIATCKILNERFKNDEEYRNKISTMFSNRMKKLHRDGKIRYGCFEGKTHSEESKQKISESMKGKGKGENNSQYGSCWITNEKENRKIKRGDLLPEGFRLGRKI